MKNLNNEYIEKMRKMWTININNPETCEEVEEEKEKKIVERDAKDELNNVIAHVGDFFDISIDDIYDMRVESLMEYVREMVR